MSHGVSAAFFVHVRVVIIETDPLNKSLRAQGSTVNYRHNVVQQISRTYSPCISETLYPLERISSFPASHPLPLTTTILLFCF